MMSSLKASFRPSARDCSRPNGPTRLGPGRTCIRADDLALEPDREQRHHAPGTTKTPTTLIEDQPPRVVAEVGQRRVLGEVVTAHLLLRTSRRPPAAAIGRPASPATAPEACGARVEPGELVGSQTTPSGMSVIAAGRVIAPRSVPTVTGSPSATPRPAAVALADPDHRRPGGAGQVLVAVEQAPRSISWCQVASTASPGAAAAATAAGADRGRARRGRARVAGSAPSSRADRWHVAGSRSSTPSSRGQRVEHPGVGHRGGVAAPRSNGAQPALPVEVRAGLLDHRRDREDHVGPPGHRAQPQLQADQEADRVQRLARPAAGRPGRPGRRRRPPARRAGRPRRRRGSRRCPGRPSSGCTPAPGPTRRPARPGRPASLTGRPPGSRLGRQPASTAPRSPARRGTQASLAPVSLGQRGRGGQRHPGRSPAARRRSGCAPSAGSAPRAASRRVGQHARPRRRARSGCSVRAELLEPAGGERRDRVHRQRPLAGTPCAAAGRGSGTPPPAPARPAPPPAPSRRRRR